MKSRTHAPQQELEGPGRLGDQGGPLAAQDLVGNAAIAQGLGPVQLHGSGGGVSAGGRQDRAQRGIQGQGGPMPFQRRLEQAFGGHDLSGIQAHQDAPARAALGELGADGFMMGHHAAFDGAPDFWLPAHEGAHYVMQQAGVGPSGPAGQAGDAYERHADEVANRAVAGQPMGDLLPAPGAMRGASAAPSIQAYTTESVGDVSENGKSVLAGRQELYAEASPLGRTPP